MRIPYGDFEKDLRVVLNDGTHIRIPLAQLARIEIPCVGSYGFIDVYRNNAYISIEKAKATIEEEETFPETMKR